MKAFLTVLFIAIFSHSNAQNIWEERDPVNGPPRAAAACFSLNGEVFMVGGIDVEEFKRKMYSCDLEQDDWDNEISLGGETGEGLARASSVGFSALGYGFVTLGAGSIPTLKDLWRYDPETESWTQMADFIGQARNGAVAFSIDNITFVGTGSTEDGVSDDFYAYNALENSWSEIAPFPGGARKEAVGFTMGGKGYVGTGRGEAIFYNDFWEYYPVEDTWTEKASLPGSPRLGAVGCGVFPRAYILLGEDNSSEYREDVWEYNYFGDIWTQRADFLGGTRSQASAAVVDGRIFVGLGYNGIYHDDFYEYVPLPVDIAIVEHSNFRLYPNPATETIMIELNSAILNPRIQCMDLTGRDISQQFDIHVLTSNKLSLVVDQNIAPGTFILSVFDGEIKLNSTTIILQ